MRNIEEKDLEDVLEEGQLFWSECPRTDIYHCHEIFALFIFFFFNYILANHNLFVSLIIKKNYDYDYIEQVKKKILKRTPLCISVQLCKKRAECPRGKSWRHNICLHCSFLRLPDHSWSEHLVTDSVWKELVMKEKAHMPCTYLDLWIWPMSKHGLYNCEQKTN